MTRATHSEDDTISVYWQTGCTSCLRTKEFLNWHGVDFRSRNVLEDQEALDELARFGLRRVPIVVRGDKWADGQVLRDVAKLCGIAWGNQKILPPDELRRRISAIIRATQANVLHVPEASIQTHLPNRPRSYADLAYHIFNIVDAFVEHEEGIPLAYEAYYRVPPKEMQTPQRLAEYGEKVAGRFNDWFDENGEAADWERKADVYYGQQSLQEFLERTTWHSAQQARQLVWVLDRMGIVPAQTLESEVLRELPMPEKGWDDEPATA